MLPLFELNAINVQDNQPGAVLVSTIPSVKFLALGSFWEVIEQAYLSPAFSRALPYNFPKTSQTQKLPKPKEFYIRDRIGSSLIASLNARLLKKGHTISIIRVI